jgi:hypothetical protein
MLLYLSTNEPTAYVCAGLDLGSDHLNYCSEIRIEPARSTWTSRATRKIRTSHDKKRYAEDLCSFPVKKKERTYSVSESRDEVRNTLGYTEVARAENGSPKMEA